MANGTQLPSLPWMPGVGVIKITLDGNVVGGRTVVLMITSMECEDKLPVASVAVAVNTCTPDDTDAVFHE